MMECHVVGAFALALAVLIALGWAVGRWHERRLERHLADRLFRNEVTRLRDHWFTADLAVNGIYLTAVRRRCEEEARRAAGRR